MRASPRRLRLSLALGAAFLAACGAPSNDELMTSAKTYLAKNDPRSASIQLKTLLQQEPDRGEARFLLGQALLLSGDAPAAVLELKKALALEYPKVAVIPPLAAALLLSGKAQEVIASYAGTQLDQPAAHADLKATLAAAHVQRGDLNAAQVAVDAAFRSVPSHPQAMVVQAQLLAGSGKFDDALTTIDKALVALPNDMGAWLLKGHILLNGKGNPGEAMKAYRKAVGLNPTSLAAWASTYSIALMQGDVAEAERQLADMRKMLPGHPQTKQFEGELAYLKRDFRRARELSAELLKLGGDSAAVLHLAGSAELSGGSLHQAEAHFSKALQINPASIASRRGLAQTYLRMAQPDKALATLRPLLSPGDPASLALAAQAYVQAGDWEHAEEYFGRAVKLNPVDVKSKTALAMTHLERTRGGDSSLAELQSIADTDPGSYADLALVSALIKRKQYDKALVAIAGIEKKLPGKATAADLQGRVHLLRKDLAAARRSFERAVTIDPLFVTSVKSLAELDIIDKRPDQARKRFESVIAADPKNLAALLALAGLAERAGAKSADVTRMISDAAKLNPTDPAPRILLVERLLTAKSTKPALDAAQDAVAAFPSSPEALDALGRAQLAAGDFNQALASYGKLSSLLPNSTLALIRTADVHVATNDLRTARQQLGKALALTPNLIDAQTRLIAIELSDRRPDDAVAVARIIQKQRPTEGIGYRLEGDVEASRKKFDAAATAFRQALDRTPTGVVAARLHTMLVATGKAPAAAALASTWARQHPEDVNFPYYLGERARDLKDYAVAEEQYRKVIAIKPDDVVALNNVAWLMVQLKKPGAAALAKKASDLRPEVASLLDTLALALMAENQIPQALDAQKRALVLAPDAHGFRLNLARIYLQAGDKKSARSELEKLSALGDRFVDHAEVARLAASL